MKILVDFLMEKERKINASGDIKTGLCLKFRREKILYSPQKKGEKILRIW